MSQTSWSRRLPSRDYSRTTPRLPGFDYTRSGSYFVTSCIQNRACLFAEVADCQLRLTEAGKMVERWWRELPKNSDSGLLAVVI